MTANNKSVNWVVEDGDKQIRHASRGMQCQDATSFGGVHQQNYQREKKHAFLLRPHGPQTKWVPCVACPAASVTSLATMIGCHDQAGVTSEPKTPSCRFCLHKHIKRYIRILEEPRQQKVLGLLGLHSLPRVSKQQLEIETPKCTATRQALKTNIQAKRIPNTIWRSICGI